MISSFRYQRGDLLVDVQLQGAPYRVLRRLRDEDTGVALYVIQRIDDNNELLRNGKLIDNPACFMLYTEAQ